MCSWNWLHWHFGQWIHRRCNSHSCSLINSLMCAIFHLFHSDQFYGSIRRYPRNKCSPLFFEMSRIKKGEGFISIAVQRQDVPKQGEGGYCEDILWNFIWKFVILPSFFLKRQQIWDFIWDSVYWFGRAGKFTFHSILRESKSDVQIPEFQLKKKTSRFPVFLKKQQRIWNVQRTDHKNRR